MNCPNCQKELISNSTIDNEQQMYCSDCDLYMTSYKICECGADVIEGECFESCGRLSWSWKLPNEIKYD